MQILLVDDDQDSRTYVGDFLRELGHDVVVSEDGEAALKTFQDGFFHLVISDIKMPRLSGIELLQKLSARPDREDFDVVLFTGHSDVNTAVEALRAGAYDYLLKPINVEELAAVTERAAERQALRRENRALNEQFEVVVKEATEETRHELSRLREAYLKSVGLGELGIFSEPMKKVIRQAEKLQADRSVPVLISGETGTGKELIARYIHYQSGDASTPFIDLNCAALAPGLFESELFGYEAGAFTGGQARGQKGKLDLARGGTIFLDEIAEIPVSMQAKLLRVIQEKEYYRVGGLKKLKTDTRIICATNVDVRGKIEEGSFRQDLYYRLNVGHIHLPPLRQRTDDILPLAQMFLLGFAREKRKSFKTITHEAAGMLLSYDWPGNVRELKNTIEWAVLMWDDQELKPGHLEILTGNIKSKPQAAAGIGVIDHENFFLPPRSLPLEEYCNNIILKALEKFNGNKTLTAKYLGISRRSLYCRLERLGL
ncbi:sigma-54-dependent transcriptional regulator [Pelotomaculum propionicicum]|uniref:Stage 0 sporulation protein A homolog n=1 Tax=Pelotomaculum propionicicum TaxID=258475 RepID=A0A4Y7RSA0_9FIRM|nr:sigma-54 dependent transcriptional regulator [Pelotomaculum propionicicum]NLI12468.1 sigma-54-dependent Fis family transcriptional regulator [Peptococcaceae bacterium]TEB11904.1 Transcriptional regulatory protein ZraR [Pelotomaculum propionicicum]